MVFPLSPKRLPRQEDDGLILGGVHAAAQAVDHLPELALKSIVTSVVSDDYALYFRLGTRYPFGHAIVRGASNNGRLQRRALHRS